MYGYVYITINLISNKKYIGKHKSETFDENYKGSGIALKNAIKKYGQDNFICKILKKCDSLEELNYWEKHFTEKYNAVKSPDFYNLKEGGDGGGAPGCRYMTNGTECKKVLLENVDVYLENGYSFGGPIPSKETILKRANANRGKKHPTAGAKISKALSGRKLSDCHKKKLSKSHKGKISVARKSVQCVETGKIYSSLHEATKDLGYKSAGNLCSCLKGRRDVAFGYHWKYAD